MPATWTLRPGRIAWTWAVEATPAFFFGELVGDLVEAEGARAGDDLGVRHGLREIGEERRHLLGALQGALGVGEEAPARGREVRLLPDADEHVLQLLAGAVVGVDVVGRDQREAQLLAQAPHRLDAALVARR
jgi:hypothetical protein